MTKQQGPKSNRVTRLNKIFIDRTTPASTDISTLHDPRVQSRPDDTDA